MRWRTGFALFLITLATRLPFATQHLWAHDSVLYARAIEDFDPVSHQPQPPGYLYYVMALRLISLIVGDPNRAMTLVSAVSAALAVLLLYGFAARLFGEWTGRASALMLLTAVAFWGYGAVAYPYTLLAALSIGCAWLFWRVITASESRIRRLAEASVGWGLALGFRADLLLLLAPLWLWAAVSAGRAGLVVSVGIVGALGAAWIGLSGLASDGVGTFVQATRAQAQFIEQEHSVFRNGLPALRDNAYDLGRFLLRSLYAIALPLSAAVLALIVWPRFRQLFSTDRGPLMFVAAWALMPLAVYLLLHVGDVGYVFSVLPAACILATRAVSLLSLGSQRPRLAVAAIGLIVIANAALFLFADVPASAQDLARRDRGLAEKAAFIDDLATRGDVVIVAGHDRAVVKHYVGERHNVIGFTPNQLKRVAKICSEIRCPGRVTVVLWDDDARVRGSGWRTERMGAGARLRLTTITENQDLHLVDRNTVELLPPGI